MINPLDYTDNNNQSIDLLQGNDNSFSMGNNYYQGKPIQNKNYKNLIGNELIKMGYSFTDSKFVPELIMILNDLSSPNTFNKTLFSYIISTANFDTEKPIKLSDFFDSYLEIYASMKECRDNICVEIIDTNNQIEKLKKQLIEIQNYETLKSDGITSNSSLQIIFKNNKEKIGNISINKLLYSHVDFGIEEPLIFNFNETVIKKEIKIDNLKVLDFPIKVYIKTEIEDKLVDILNIKDLLENVVNRNYDFFQFSFLYINSMVNFTNKKIYLFMKDVNALKNDVTILNTLINYLEVIFKNYFQQIPRAQYSNYIGKTFGNELEITEKIENIILKIIGRPIVSNWSKITFFINKIMFLLSLLIIVNKADILILSFCFILFSIEYNIISKKFAYKLLLFLIAINGINLIFLIKELHNLNKELPYQIPKVGKMYRKIGFIFACINSLIQVILLFSLWKMALEYKLYQLNMEQIQRRKETKTENDFIKKNYRRNINYNKWKRTINTEIKEFGKDFLE